MKVLFVCGYAETTFQRHGEIDVTTRFLQKAFSLKRWAARSVRSSTWTELRCSRQLRRDNPGRSGKSHIIAR
jgi:hypothetical protein